MRSTALLAMLGCLVVVSAARAEESPLRVSELDVCQEVVDRKCQGGGKTFRPDVEQVTFVTRVEGATGDAFVTHVWTFEGEEVRRIRLPIRRASYRTWSTKTVRKLPGRWKAEILDPIGRSLGAIEFVVLPPS
jgi:hypothetical protein